MPHFLMRTITDTVYLIIAKRKNYWRSPSVVRMSKRKPTLKAGQVAIKVEVQIPETICDPPTIPPQTLQINQTNVIQPKPEVRQA